MLLKELYLFTILTISILIVLMGLFVYLIIRKYREIRYQRLVEHEKKQLLPELLKGSITDVNLSVGKNRRIFQMALEELLKGYSDLVEGSTEREFITAMAERYLLETYRRDLTNSQWSKRMNALYHIEDFELFSLQEEVQNLLERSSVTKEESVVAIRILARAKDLVTLVRLLNEARVGLTDYDYRSIIAKLDPNRLELLTHHFDGCQDPLKWAILDMIGIRRVAAFLPFLEEIFHVDEGETKLRALKAITSIGYVTELVAYLPLQHSDKWQERMLLAKLIGSMRASEYVAVLGELLQDRLWWVRQQAGQSLLLLPNGPAELERVYKSSKDPYARDMASEWLANRLF